MIRIEGQPDLRKKIKFAPGKEDELIKHLSDVYVKAMSDRSQMIKRCKLWALQANSRRPRPDAGPQDSNLDMPLTRKRMTQNASRLKNPILQQPTIFASKPRNAKESSKRLAKQVEDGLDYMMDRFDFREFLDDWIEQFQTFPAGFVKTPFVYEREKFVRWDEIDQNQFIQFKENDEGVSVLERPLDNGEIKYYMEVEETVDTRVGCFPEVVPFEDIIVPKGTCSIDTADVVFHRIYLSDMQLKGRVREGMYDKRWNKDDMIDAIGPPSAQRDRLLVHMNAGTANSGRESDASQHELLECYLSFDVDDDGVEEEIICTYHPAKGILLRADHNGFHGYRRPFISYCYKRIIGSIYGDSLAFILEPLHVANSASINQRLDAASLANTVTLFVPPNANLKRILAREGLRAQVYESDIDPQEIFQFQVKQQFSQLPQLEALFEKSADELSALSPYSFGIEQSERPTVGGTVTIVEESKQPQYDMLERFRRRLSLLAKHMLSRYRQYFPEGLIYYMGDLEPDGQQAMKKLMIDWPQGVIENDVVVETRASSAHMSRVARKQEAVALMNQLPMYQDKMMQLATVAVDAMNPAAPVANQLLVGLHYTLNELLTEMEVAGKQKINPDLGKAIDFGQKVQQAIQQITQERDMLAQRLSMYEGGGAGPPQGPPGGQGVPGQSGSPQPGGFPGAMPNGPGGPG